MKKYFHENEQGSRAFDEKVARVCDGLMYMSETDAPLTLFKVASESELSSSTIASAAGIDADPVEEVSFEEWFARLTREEDWWGVREKDIAKRFSELRGVLEECLRDLKVFRFGRIRIDIFIVGIDSEGRIAGVRTHAVET